MQADPWGPITEDEIRTLSDLLLETCRTERPDLIWTLADA
jgi:hypothetical protein